VIEAVGFLARQREHLLCARREIALASSLILKYMQLFPFCPNHVGKNQLPAQTAVLSS